MAFLEGKTPTERNKIIAAAVLGLVALVALYFAFGRSGGGSTANATAKNSPTPKPSVAPAETRVNVALPSATEQDFAYQTTAVVYHPGSVGAPDPGRNIFAFYEPEAPCRGVNCPSPTPKPVVIITPSPTPVPPIFIASIGPSSVFAGQRGFRLSINGDKFTPDAHVYLSQSELPTTFVNTQTIFADVPAKLIAQEGSPQIIVQTPDGKAYSNQVFLTVQPPPKPTFLYIGMIGRKRYNNDTAYFTETDKSPPFGARLNDVISSVSGRFRLIDMSSAEAVVEDVTLGFKYHLPISKTPSAPGLGQPTKGIPGDGGFPQFNPGNIPPQTDIPGIPNNVQRYSPSDQKKEEKKEDVDDEGDG